MKLNITAPINKTSYGYVGYNFFKGLSNIFDVILFPIQNMADVDNPHELPRILSAANNYISYDRKAPSLKIWHQFDLFSHPSSGPRIAYTIFELNRFTPTEIASLESQDFVIVPSNWAKEVILANTQLKDNQVFVVPLGVDTSIFKPNYHQVASLHPEYNHKCIFLNMGKWEKRKGHDILKNWFDEAFPDEKDVELWMCPTNPFLSQDETITWTRKYIPATSSTAADNIMGAANYIGDRTRIFNRLNTTQDVANLMNLATFGVFPSRAEGWNLELLEMMACGKACVATNYSAHTEYATIDNCRLIDISTLEMANDNKWFRGQGDWAQLGESQKSQFIEHVRNLYELWKYSSIPLVATESIETAYEFTWDKAVEKLSDVLWTLI